MHAQNLALTRARGMAALPRHVEEACGWRGVALLFERQGLPLTLLDHPDMLIPMRSMQGLFDDAALAVGDRCFGLRVGQAMSFADYGVWGRYIASAPTLGAALRRAAKTLWMHQSGASMGAATCGAHTMFFYEGPPVRTHRKVGQHADHVIWPMVTLVREFLGPLWMPDWIEVDYPRDPDAAAMEARMGRPVLFSKPAVAIAIPTERLRTPGGKASTLRNRVSFDELRAQYIKNSPRRFLQRVEAVVSLRLLDGATDVEGSARILGLSPRSLQRLLEQEGVSYRRLLEACRLRRAIALLEDERHSVTSIALSLGYEEPGNFARAFRRWTGKSPKQFRLKRAPPASPGAAHP